MHAKYAFALLDYSVLVAAPSLGQNYNTIASVKHDLSSVFKTKMTQTSTVAKLVIIL
jgi:hypothetical protein